VEAAAQLFAVESDQSMNTMRKDFVMSVENSVRLLAGSMVIVSLVLYYFVSPWWLLVTAFVGFNLVQSSFTKFCPAEIIIKRLKGQGQSKVNSATTTAQ
jgi:F0F1-type ATP synthase assembly protein I